MPETAAILDDDTDVTARATTGSPGHDVAFLVRRHIDSLPANSLEVIDNLVTVEADATENTLRIFQSSRNYLGAGKIAAIDIGATKAGAANQ